MAVASPAAAGTVDPGVTPDTGTQKLPVLLAERGLAEVDRADVIERDVRAFLQEETPGIGFLGEEEGQTGSAEMRWVLDPIDGTANFVRGLPLCRVARPRAGR
ncbi:hypothetical protein GKC29_22435 [Micromonospora sp. WMMC415]|nr:hypothetical protein GKC29_22435 [Micromonospora sp. WMMC415]